MRGVIELKQFRTYALPAAAAFEIYTPDRVYHLMTENGNMEEAHKYELITADLHISVRCPTSRSCLRIIYTHRQIAPDP